MDTKCIELHKGLRLTSSEDGIFLHFDSGDKQSGVCLDFKSELWQNVAYKWASKLFEEIQQGQSTKK